MQSQQRTQPIPQGTLRLGRACRVASNWEGEPGLYISSLISRWMWVWPQTRQRSSVEGNNKEKDSAASCYLQYSQQLRNECFSTGIPRFIACGFIALHRCVFHKIKARTLHQQKGYDLLYWDGQEPKPRYLRDVPILKTRIYWQHPVSTTIHIRNRYIFLASFILKGYCICTPTPAFWVSKDLLYLYSIYSNFPFLEGLFVSILNSIPLKMIFLKN